jgi:hypothetical protein
MQFFNTMSSLSLTQVPSIAQGDTSDKGCLVMPDLTFKSKGELRRMIEFLYLEKSKKEQPPQIPEGQSLEYSELNFNKLVYEVARLKKELKYSRCELNSQLDKTNFYQDQVLLYQDMILTSFGIENKPFMKVAE